MGFKNTFFLHKKIWLALLCAGIALTILIWIRTIHPPQIPIISDIPYNLIVDHSDFTIYSCSAVEANNIYIVYFEKTYGDLVMIKSTDGGRNWPISARRVIDDKNVTGYYPCLIRDDSILYVSYYDITEENLKFAKSMDNGVTWLENDIKVVDSFCKPYYFTSITSEDENIYIFYYDHYTSKLKITQSTNFGLTWPEELKRDIDSFGSLGSCRSITVKNNNIYMVYQDIAYSRLKVAVILDGEDDLRIYSVDQSPGTGKSASIDIFNNRVFVLYCTYNNSNLSVRIASNTLDMAWPDWRIQTIEEQNIDYQENYEWNLHPTSLGHNPDIGFVQYYVLDTLKFARSRAFQSFWKISIIECDAPPESDMKSGFFADMVVEGENIYISHKISDDLHWNLDDEVNILYLSKSTNSGEEWKNLIANTWECPNQNPILERYPSMTYDGKYHYIAYWIDTTQLCVARISEKTRKVDFIKEIEKYSLPAWSNPCSLERFYSIKFSLIQSSSDRKELYVLYLVDYASYGLAMRLAISSDSGLTWNKTTVDSNSYACTPNITTYNGRIYISYNKSLQIPQNCLIVSNDGGLTWENILSCGTPFEGVFSNSVKVIDGIILFFYYDNYLELKLARSNDNGASWEHIMIDPDVNFRQGNIQPIQVINFGRSIYIAYNKPIHIAKSTDLGTTWQITDLSTTAHNNYKFVMNSSGEMYVSYKETCYLPRDFFLMKSTDYGTTWNTDNPLNINQFNEIISSFHDINFINGVLFFTYYEKISNTLRFTCSVNHGETWPKWEE